MPAIYRAPPRKAMGLLRHYTSWVCYGRHSKQWRVGVRFLAVGSSWVGMSPDVGARLREMFQA